MSKLQYIDPDLFGNVAGYINSTRGSMKSPNVIWDECHDGHQDMYRILFARMKSGGRWKVELGPEVGSWGVQGR